MVSPALKKRDVCQEKWTTEQIPLHVGGSMIGNFDEILADGGKRGANVEMGVHLGGEKYLV